MKIGTNSSFQTVANSLILTNQGKKKQQVIAWSALIQTKQQEKREKNISFRGHRREEQQINNETDCDK